MKNHIVVVEKYSSGHAQYCDREGQVLMTKVLKWHGNISTDAQYCVGGVFEWRSRVLGLTGIPCYDAQYCDGGVFG